MSTATEELKKMENERYKVNYELTIAIINVIYTIRPGLSASEAQEIFQEWTRDEDGAIAMTQLVNLIIY